PGNVFCLGPINHQVLAVTMRQAMQAIQRTRIYWKRFLCRCLSKGSRRCDENRQQAEHVRAKWFHGRDSGTDGAGTGVGCRSQSWSARCSRSSTTVERSLISPAAAFQSSVESDSSAALASVVKEPDLADD